MAELLDESTIIICQTQKLMNMMNRLRLGPIINDFDLVLHDLHSSVSNDMSAEFNFLLVEDAFCWVCKEFVSCKYLKYLLQMVQIVLVEVEQNGISLR